MEWRRISKEYYRDDKCEEIERIIREDPYYDGWKVMRFRSFGGLSDYEDSFEIQNAKRRRVTELSESEVDLLISSGTLPLFLYNVWKLGFFNRFGRRAPYVILLLVISAPFFAFVMVMFFFQYINTLPAEQTLLGFMGFFAILLILVGILCYSQRDTPRRDFRVDSRSKQHPISADTLEDVLDRVDELKDLKQNDPAEYLRRLRELNDE